MTTAGRLRISEIVSLAAIGTSGAHSKNALRDLEQKLTKTHLSDAMHTYKATVRSTLSRFVTMSVVQSVLLPHVLFASMWEHHRDMFNRVFAGPSGEVSAFWRAVAEARCPNIDMQPALADETNRSRVVPLAIHGDGVPVAGIGKGWAKILDVYSMYSLTARGQTRDLVVPFYAIFANLMTRAGTETTWEVLRWSFDALATGLWPTTDAYGIPIAGGRRGPLASGWKAIVWCVAGDFGLLLQESLVGELFISPPMRTVCL